MSGLSKRGTVVQIYNGKLPTSYTTMSNSIKDFRYILMLTTLDSNDLRISTIIPVSIMSSSVYYTASTDSAYVNVMFNGTNQVKRENSGSNYINSTIYGIY